MLLKKPLLGLALLGTIFATSCRTDEMDLNLPELDYDTPLRQAIEDASEGQGLSYFRLPNSTEFDQIPQDPGNPITTQKVKLGQLLYHETGIGQANVNTEGFQTFSCASCHFASAGFQANRQQGLGEGGMGFGINGEGRDIHPSYEVDEVDFQPIRTPTAMNGAWQDIMLWNGQFGGDPTGPNAGTEDQWAAGTPIWNNQFGYQGLETQAIAGLSVHRMVIEQAMCEEYIDYDELFDQSFPEFSEANRVTARTGGLAIAAYERTMLSNQAPWQDYVRGNSGALTDRQKQGATLFFGKANCNACHSGPALNSMTFHALGMPDLVGPGVYGDGSVDANKGRGGFTGNSEDDYKFKTPQLYNLKDSPFMGHGGTFTSVREVIEYKNLGIKANSDVPNGQLADEFGPLNLTNSEIVALTDFIENALYDPNLKRYEPADLPTGFCFPNADTQSSSDLGCN